MFLWVMAFFKARHPPNLSLAHSCLPDRVSMAELPFVPTVSPHSCLTSSSSDVSDLTVWPS